MKTHGHCSRTYKSPTYVSWTNMKHRCIETRNVEKPYYLDKGISVCERWLDFNNFLVDMGERPKNTTLDRINPLQGYSKENCRWATGTEQNHNQLRRKDNKTGKKGVSWDNRREKWYAQGWANGLCQQLYYGDSYEDAVKAREKWESKNNVR